MPELGRCVLGWLQRHLAISRCRSGTPSRGVPSAGAMMRRVRTGWHAPLAHGHLLSAQWTPLLFGG